MKLCGDIVSSCRSRAAVQVHVSGRWAEQLQQLGQLDQILVSEWMSRQKANQRHNLGAWPVGRGGAGSPPHPLHGHH